MIDKSNELKRKGQVMQAMRSLEVQAKGRGLIDCAYEIERMAYYLEAGSHQTF